MNTISNLTLAVLFAAVLALSCNLDGPDDMEAARATAADAEDAAALASREWVAQQKCGPRATGLWVGDDLRCVPDVVVTGSRP